MLSFSGIEINSFFILFHRTSTWRMTFSLRLRPGTNQTWEQQKTWEYVCVGFLSKSQSLFSARRKTMVMSNATILCCEMLLRDVKLTVWGIWMWSRELLLRSNILTVPLALTISLGNISWDCWCVGMPLLMYAPSQASPTHGQRPVPTVTHEGWWLYNVRLHDYLNPRHVNLWRPSRLWPVNLCLTSVWEGNLGTGRAKCMSQPPK